MPTPQEAFIDLISRIVHEQMSEDQQTQFDIEGKEMIEGLFNPDRIKNGISFETIPVLSISPASLEVFNATTGFGALVVSCITLYIEMRRRKKKSSINERLDRLEYLNALKERLSNHNMPPEFIKAIEDRYIDELIKILNDL